MEKYKEEVQERQNILLKSAIKVVNEQIIERINRTVKSNGDITIKIHESGKLSGLKKEMNNLADVEVPEKLKGGFERFCRDDYKMIREKQDYELNEELFSLYKNVINEAGKLLRKYGYTHICGEYENGKYGFIHMNNNTMGPKPDNEDLIREQSKWLIVIRKYIEIVDKVENEREASIAKQAAELWENA